MDVGTALKPPSFWLAALLVVAISLWPIGASCAVPEAMAASPSTSTGTISGLITQPPGPHTPVSLMLENLQTLGQPRMVMHDGVIIRHEQPGPRHWSDRLGR